MAIRNRKRMGSRQLLAVFLALVGTFLIAAGGNPANMNLSGAGLIFGLLAAIGVITYTLLSRPVVAVWGNLMVTGWGMLIGGLTLFLAIKCLAASFRPGCYGLAPCGSHCPHRNSPWLLHFSGGRQAHRPRKGNPHRLSGACLRHSAFRPVSGNPLFPAGA